LWQKGGLRRPLFGPHKKEEKKKSTWKKSASKKKERIFERKSQRLVFVCICVDDRYECAAGWDCLGHKKNGMRKWTSE